MIRGEVAETERMGMEPGVLRPKRVASSATVGCARLESAPRSSLYAVDRGTHELVDTSSVLDKVELVADVLGCALHLLHQSLVLPPEMKEAKRTQVEGPTTPVLFCIVQNKSAGG